MNCNIITVANPKSFEEVLNAFKYSLEELGHNVKIVDNTEKNYGHLNIVVKALRSYDHNVIPGIRILFQTEELWNRREKGIYDLSKGWKRVLELYPENLKLRNTENVVYFPIGYSRAFEINLPEQEEDLDVYFFGSMTKRRKSLKIMLENSGLKVRIVEGEFGEKRNINIMRSKIILNMKAHDLWSYGPLHCLLAQCSKKFMLCEHTGIGYGIYKPGKHFAEFKDPDDMIPSIKWWLDHEKERKNFANNAYDDIKNNMNFTNILKGAIGDLLRR